MPSQHILITRNGDLPLTGDVRALVGGARDVYNRALQTKQVMDQIASGDDWTSLGTALGVTATEAQTVYNLVSAIMDEMTTSADVLALIARLG